MLKCVVLSFTLISATLASLAYGPLEPKPEKFMDKEGCYISELDTVLPYNKALPSQTGCMEYWCDQKYVSYTSCGVAIASPPCKLVEEKQKPYPECCPRISCPIVDANNASNTN